MRMPWGARVWIAAWQGDRPARWLLFGIFIVLPAIVLLFDLKP